MSPRKNTDIPETWDEWTDALGQTYQPGDFIAYAMISGRSPQLVFARVLQIRRLDGNYEEIVESYWDYEHLNDRGGPTRLSRPSCKVKVQPLHDARGFYRSGTFKNDHWRGGTQTVRAVTLSIPENIIKVDPRPEWTDEHAVEDLTALRRELQSE